MLGCCVGPRDDDMSAVHFIVHDALTETRRGKIMCIPPPRSDRFAVHSWACVSDPTVSEEDLGLDASRLCADRVPCGRYELCFADVDGAPRRQLVVVACLSGPCVVGYDAHAPSSSIAHDGAVRARVEHCPPEARFAWANGATTAEPVLAHVPAGTYSVAIVVKGDDGFAYLHACARCQLVPDPARAAAR